MKYWASTFLPIKIRTPLPTLRAFLGVMYKSASLHTDTRKCSEMLASLPLIPPLCSRPWFSSVLIQCSVHRLDCTELNNSHEPIRQLFLDLCLQALLHQREHSLSVKSVIHGSMELGLQGSLKARHPPSFVGSQRVAWGVHCWCWWGFPLTSCLI